MSPRRKPINLCRIGASSQPYSHSRLQQLLATMSRTISIQCGSSRLQPAKNPSLPPSLAPSSKYVFRSDNEQRQPGDRLIEATIPRYRMSSVPFSFMGLDESGTDGNTDVSLRKFFNAPSPPHDEFSCCIDSCGQRCNDKATAEENTVFWPPKLVQDRPYH